MPVRRNGTAGARALRAVHLESRTEEQARRVMGWPVKNVDESDAAALWAWCKANHDKSFRLDSDPLTLAVNAARRVA